MASSCVSQTQETTQTEQITTTETQTHTSIRLKLQKPKTNRRVNWTENTIDNEFLNKKKSKCCCIYEKPRDWNESSSEDENEDKDCKHCIGHRKSDFNKEKNDKKKDESNEPNNENA